MLFRNYQELQKENSELKKAFTEVRDLKSIFNHNGCLSRQFVNVRSSEWVADSNTLTIVYVSDV